MAKIAESILIEYLNRKGFAVAQSVKRGVNEWDVFALNCLNGIEARHYEVQVSFDPVSSISGGAGARTEGEIDQDMGDWYSTKFNSEKVKEVRSLFYPGDWKKFFVHGTVKDKRELDWLTQKSVTLVPFSVILNELCLHHPKQLRFTAEQKDLIELIRNARSGIT